MICFINILMILTYYVIGVSDCQESDLATSQGPKRHDQCPLFFFYNFTTKQCECYSSSSHALNGIVKCTEHEVSLSNGYCMTYDEEKEVSIGICLYMKLSGHNVSESGCIKLPENISELNDYMCGPMERNGILCGECINGFGPSVTFVCSNCTNNWYGVPLYLFLELVPVSVFFLIILIFQVNLTSAPMVSFVLYCNVILMTIKFDFITLYDKHQSFVSFTALVYGIWSLDFFRYAIPPFCISPKLNTIHIIYLENVSTICPFILISITWIGIELYSRNFKLVVWLWRTLNRLFIKFIKYINVEWDSTKTIVDTFATFFLLSYTKLTMLLLLPLDPIKVYKLNVNNINLSTTTSWHAMTNPGVEFASKHHLPYVVVSIFVFVIVILPPVILLALYPVSTFRLLLFKCCRSMASLNIFVEKFYGCYRDGLDGGRDMRSFASLYFIVVLFGYVLIAIGTFRQFAMSFLFGGCSLLQ